MLESYDLSGWILVRFRDLSLDLGLSILYNYKIINPHLMMVPPQDTFFVHCYLPLKVTPKRMNVVTADFIQFWVTLFIGKCPYANTIVLDQL